MLDDGLACASGEPDGLFGAIVGVDVRSIEEEEEAIAVPEQLDGEAKTRVITVQMPAPTSFSTALDATNSRIVHLYWASLGAGVTYRLERSTCSGCGWSQIPGSVATSSADFTADATTLPAARLYHVIAMASGTTDSPPSNFDYATTANQLFAETIEANGVTTIKGSHIQELRLAIDALRSTANLGAYMPPTYETGWSNYDSPAGLVIRATDFLSLRTALDEAVFSLFTAHLTFSGETPAVGGVIYAYQLTQLRAGVK